jgi:hypothetical protein
MMMMIMMMMMVVLYPLFVTEKKLHNLKDDKARAIHYKKKRTYKII